MQRSTALFLILLRLAIGWHFLVEGWQKIDSTYLVGETVYNRPFSSAGYFREAPGPLGSLMRSYVGDPDEEALALLTVRPIPEGEDPATYKPQDRVPEALERQWQAYLVRFVRHYGLDEEERPAAEKKLQQAKANVVEWLTYEVPATQAERDKDARYEKYTTEVTRSYPSGDVKRRMTLAERISEYRAKVDELRDITGRKLWLFGRDVEGARLRQVKADVARLRAGLLADLDKQTQAYQASLQALLNDEQKAKGPLPGPKPEGLVHTIDTVTPWMLFGIGACLLVGLFSRLSAALAALFLLMTYLAVPSLPWYPAPPVSEGNYLFVNKNLIEMFALCVLATVATGRWFGLDAVLHALTTAIFGKKA